MPKDITILPILVQGLGISSFRNVKTASCSSTAICFYWCHLLIQTFFSPQFSIQQQIAFFTNETFFQPAMKQSDVVCLQYSSYRIMLNKSFSDRTMFYIQSNINYLFLVLFKHLCNFLPCITSLHTIFVLVAIYSYIPYTGWPT